MSVTLEHPTPVYTAASNAEAQMLASFLNDREIAAVGVDDVSMMGVYAFGQLPGIHRPQVFVEKEDLTVAREFLVEFESTDRPRNDQAYCYHCGAQLSDNEVQLVQCPECQQELDLEPEVDGEPSGRLAPNKVIAFLMLSPIVGYVLSVLVAKLAGL